MLRFGLTLNRNSHTDELNTECTLIVQSKKEDRRLPVLFACVVLN